MLTHGLLELPRTRSDFDLFVAAVEAAGLEDLFASAREPLTIFAPTDDAFGGITDAMLTLLVGACADERARLVRSHIVRGLLSSCALAGVGWLSTLDGHCVNVDALGAQTLVDGALIVNPDIDLGTCIMHGIDRVLRQT
jgi:uncharacterized surface protein with fasciclin (FAS1) repeats